MECVVYGKPELPTYEYAEEYLKERANKQGVEISRFYMIGDNPESDIEGARRKGWESILVKTGIFKQ